MSIASLPPRRARAAVAALLLLSASAAARPAAAQDVADSAATVDRLFRWATTASPGCAVGVARGGQPVLQRAYGMANLEYDVPNTPETVFEAGSVSKQFTAAAVALLEQDGKLSLDDPVRKYIPELPEYRQYGAPITIRQMLTHTSGLRDWGSVAAAGGWPRGSRTYTQAHALEIASRQRDLNHAPGAEYIYSNTNYNLAAIIVERVSGMRFADFTRTRLFEPLGMTHTQWRDDYRRIVKQRATAYAGAGAGPFRQDMPFENVHGNGGLLTTVGDLLRWNENLARPAVGGARLVRTLETRGRVTSGRQISYAHGLVVTRYKGIPEVQHGGATAGYRAFLTRFPEQRLSVALLCNAGSANPAALAHQVADVFLAGQLPQAQQAAAGAEPVVALPAAQLEEKVGSYRNTRTQDAIPISLRDGKLYVRGAELRPLSRTTFVAADGARGEFTLDAQGRPRRLLVIDEEADSVVYEPVSQWTPTGGELASLAGTYASDEADGRAVVWLGGGRLFARLTAGDSAALTPIYRDAFAVPGFGLVRFQRDARGRATALSIGSTRARDVVFRRVR